MPCLSVHYNAFKMYNRNKIYLPLSTLFQLFILFLTKKKALTVKKDNTLNQLFGFNNKFCKSQKNIKNSIINYTFFIRN